MSQHLQTALKLYESRNIDIQSLIGWHLLHGAVVSTSDVFGMCYYSNSNNPTEPVCQQDADTLFVTICSGHMASFLELFHKSFQYVSFQRDFKHSNRVRLLNMEKLHSKLR